MEVIQLNEDEVLLSRRLDDLFAAVQNKNVCKFTNFLDERQAMVALATIRKKHFTDYLFWGGFSEAERVILGFFPDYMQPQGEAFPIVPITVTYRKEDKLSHRDFLGALMNLMIKRELIGDILVQEGQAVLFVHQNASKLVLEELKRVGRVGVKCSASLPATLPAAHQYKELSGTISSPRLDALVAMLAGISREKASNLIKSGLVMQNCEIVDSPSNEVAQEDKLSIRGYGKYILQRIGPVTKKGRVSISCLKYI